MKTKRRLALGKQTIANLTPGRLGLVAGGNGADPPLIPFSTVPACVSNGTVYECQSLVRTYCGC